MGAHARGSLVSRGLRVSFELRCLMVFNAHAWLGFLLIPVPAFCDTVLHDTVPLRVRLINKGAFQKKSTGSGARLPSAALSPREPGSLRHLLLLVLVGDAGPPHLAVVTSLRSLKRGPDDLDDRSGSAEFANRKNRSQKIRHTAS